MKRIKIYHPLLAVLAIGSLSMTSCQKEQNIPDSTMENLPDSVIIYNYSPSSQVEKLYAKTIYCYDTKGNVIRQTESIINEEDHLYIPNIKVESSYDAHNCKVGQQEWTYIEDIDDWEERTYITFSYDAQNKLTTRVDYSPLTDGSRDSLYCTNISWIDAKQSWSYQQSRTSNGQWERSFKWNTIYNNSLLPDKEIVYMYHPSDSTWKKVYTNEYFYDHYGNMTLHYMKYDEVITNGESYQYTYDDKGRIILSIRSLLGENGVESEEHRIKYVYYY